MKTEKYKILYREHGSKVFDEFNVYDYKEAVGYKDHLLQTYKYSEIKIFHYDLVGKDIGMPKCVFNAVNLIDMKEVA
jgi:hypothetical protein